MAGSTRKLRGGAKTTKHGKQKTKTKRTKLLGALKTTAFGAAPGFTRPIPGMGGLTKRNLKQFLTNVSHIPVGKSGNLKSKTYLKQVLEKLEEMDDEYEESQDEMANDHRHVNIALVITVFTHEVSKLLRDPTQKKIFNKKADDLADLLGKMSLGPKLGASSPKKKFLALWKKLDVDPSTNPYSYLEDLEDFLEIFLEELKRASGEERSNFDFFADQLAFTFETAFRSAHSVIQSEAKNVEKDELADLLDLLTI